MAFEQAMRLDQIKGALQLTDFEAEAAWRMMMPRPRVMRRPTAKAGMPRQAAVLILLYPCDSGDFCFVLTRRTEDVSTHKGQISLPGGALDPEDASPEDAALRETCEELGVCREDIRLLGRLTPLYLGVSDFEIQPVVGLLEERPDFIPSSDEVAALHEMSLSMLLDPDSKEEEHWHFQGYELDVPFYRVDGQVLWGATAILLSEFEQRLKTVSQQQ